MTGRLDLAPKLDLPASEALAGALRDQRGSDLVVDAAAVTHIGGHALQTLLVAARSWARDQKTFSVENVGPKMSAQLEMLGMSAADLCGGPPE